MPKVHFLDRAGSRQEAEITHEIYRQAEDAGVTVPQYLNSTYRTDPDRYGTAFEQFMASCGLFQRRDRAAGIKPPTVKEILSGGDVVMNAGLITREANPASRILFPAVILEAMENKLRDDTTGYVGRFNSYVARTDTVVGNKFEFPILDFSEPEKARMMPIAQAATPHTMLTIKASDVSRRLPTYSLGMEITKEAQAITTLDLVTLALNRQAEIEQAKIVDEAIVAMYQGDVDAGTTGLTATKANVFDSTITAAGTLTHKAWVKWLRRYWRRREIDVVFCDLDTALIIENRLGKPTVTNDNPTSNRIDALAEVENPHWKNVKIFLLEDGLLPANTIMGIDSRYAMWRVNSSSADYSAIEEFVLRKVTALRFDQGFQYYRQFDQAFDVLSLTI